MSETAHPKSILRELSRVAEWMCVCSPRGGESTSQLKIKTDWWSLFLDKSIELKIQDRFKLVVKGVLQIVAGVYCILQNTNGSWLILFLAGSVIWFGFDGLLLAIVCKPRVTECKSSPSRVDSLTKLNALDSYALCLAEAKTSPETLSEILRRMTSRTSLHAAIILWPNQTGWSFKAGSKCSATMGEKVALQISQQKIQLELQSLFQIHVLDRALEALVTPGPMKSGQHFLLVTLHTINSSSKEHEWLVARHAVLDVSFHLNLILERATKGRNKTHSFCDSQLKSESFQHHESFLTKDQKLITSCSICDEVCVSTDSENQIWKPWTEWLNNMPEFSISHTVCDRCAEGYYQIT